MPEIHPMSTNLLDRPRPDDEAGPRAIEVATMLGDSVVGVTHISGPHGGRVSRATWTALAAGAAPLCAAVITFAMAVSIARTNEGAKRAWLDADRPASAFRPTPVPLPYDAVTFAGLALGGVALAWGLSRWRA